MKSTFRVTLVSILTASFLASYGQMTGGGSGGAGNSTKKESASKSKGVGIWHFGLANPMGKFLENNLTKKFDEAVGAVPGFYISYDGIAFFNETEPVRAGLAIGSGLAIIGVNWERWSQSGGYSSTPFLIGDFKLGPTLSYKIGEDFFADGFLKLGVNYGVGGSGSWSSDDWSTSTFALGFGTNFGANIRYRRLAGTFQIHSGKLNMDYSGFGLQSSYKIPISTFRLGIGLVVGGRN